MKYEKSISRYYTNYSETQCLNECKIDAVIENCKCIPGENLPPRDRSQIEIENFNILGYLRNPEYNEAKSAGDSVKACSLYQHGKCVVDYVKNFDSSHCDCIQACSERIPEGQLTQYGYDSFIET